MAGKNRAYKDSKKSAIDAVIASRARHLADNEAKDLNNSGDERSLYRGIAKKLGTEKVENLEKMVTAADKTDGAVSVDIRDDDKMFKNTKSITGDFGDDGHMSLHVIRGESKILDKNREGRMQSTGYGENDEFIKSNTKKTVKELAKDKFDKEKHKVGLKEEDLSYLFLEAQSLDEIKKNYHKAHPDWSQERVHAAAYDTRQRQLKHEKKDNNTPKNFENEVRNGQPLYKTVNGRKYIRTDNGGYALIDESLEFQTDLKNMYKLDEPKKLDILDISKSHSELEGLVNEIKDIRYGFISKKDGSMILNRDWIHNCRNLKDYYDVQEDPEFTIKNKVGICTDQCLAIKHLFNKLHPECKTQMYALMKGRFGHCVIGFMKPNNDWYYLENAWNKERGLHGPFNSQSQLEDYFRDIYYKHHKDDNDDEVILMTYDDYKKPTLNESFIFGQFLEE